jgi:NADPH:quinone reductase-like Zn-dependent oxidoreductase
MKAVGYKKSLPIDAADALIDFEAPEPEPTGRDIRVAVKAISVNPADYKMRTRVEPRTCQRCLERAALRMGISGSIRDGPDSGAMVYRGWP